MIQSYDVLQAVEICAVLSSFLAVQVEVNEDEADQDIETPRWEHAKPRSLEYYNQVFPFTLLMCFSPEFVVTRLRIYAPPFPLLF